MHYYAKYIQFLKTLDEPIIVSTISERFWAKLLNIFAHISLEITPEE